MTGCIAILRSMVEPESGEPMSKTSRLLGLLILVAVVILATTIGRQLFNRPAPEQLEALPADVDLALADLHYTQTEQGHRRWTLDADQARYLKDSHLVHLQQVRMEFYRAGRFGDVVLTSREGRFNEQSRQVEVWGDVVVTTGGGEQLLTERLRYDDVDQELTTTEPVRMLATGMELRGTGMQVDLPRGRLLLQEDVWMLIDPETAEEK